jgi:hypothetical protein
MFIIEILGFSRNVHNVISLLINPKAFVPAMNSFVFKSNRIDFSNLFSAPYDSLNEERKSQKHFETKY